MCIQGSISSSCVERKEQIELFLSNKSLIEREFCTHEFALEEGGNGGDWKALFHRLENALVFTTDMVLYCDPEFKSCNRYRFFRTITRVVSAWEKAGTTISTQVLCPLKKLTQHMSSLKDP